jgi:hypothetical protein
MLKGILNLEGAQKLSKIEQKNINGGGAPGVPSCDPTGNIPGAPYDGTHYDPAIKCPANNFYGYIWTCDTYCR